VFLGWHLRISCAKIRWAQMARADPAQSRRFALKPLKGTRISLAEI
jgi:hypothetical protein